MDQGGSLAGAAENSETTRTRGGTGQNPFSMAAAGAARRRREMQQALKSSLEMTKATEAAKERERRQKEEEAKEASAREEIDKEVAALMEIGSDEEEDEESSDNVARVLDMETESPVRKRSRPVVSRRTSTVVAATPPVLRQSSFIPHNYGYPRVIVEGSARLDGDDKVAQFIGMVGTLLTNGRMIDPFFVVNPVIIGGGKKDLKEAKDIPTNMTLLGGYMKISEKSLKTFQKKPGSGGGGKRNGGGNSNYENLVYFTFAMSCDVVPADIIAGISVEWMRAGGGGLYRKEIQAFNTYSPFVIFKLCINVAVQMLMEEFKRILEEAMKLLEEEALQDGVVMFNTTIPPFAFRKSQPKLPGLDPADYAGLSAKQSDARRAWHVEMESQNVDLFIKLIEKAKEFTLFDDYWGAHVMISEVVDYNSPPGDIARLQKEAKHHTCFQVSMTCMQLWGLIDIEGPVLLSVPREGEASGGMLSMRQVLLKHFRTRDNKSPLMAEVHQRQHGAPVEVVIPNTREAEAMIGDMNRQLPAFIKYYLLGKGFKEDFVTRLVVAACCPVLVGNMNSVTWDAKEINLITQEDGKDRESLAAFENQDWYFDLHQLRVSPKKKAHHYTAPEVLFNLDADRSVNTLHAKNDAKRAAARKGYGDSDSEEEETTDSASDERDLGKSPDGRVSDKEVGDGQRSVSFSPSGPSDGRLSPREAAGGG